MCSKKTKTAITKKSNNIQLNATEKGLFYDIEYIKSKVKGWKRDTQQILTKKKTDACRV